MSRRRNESGNPDKYPVLKHKNGYQRDDFVTSSEDEFSRDTDDDEGAFEPIREAGKVQKSRKRSLGPPITMDDKLDQLNETHRMIVEDFLIRGKKECNKVRLDSACLMDGEFANSISSLFRNR
jgi:hypothetical protein